MGQLLPTLPPPAIVGYIGKKNDVRIGLNALKRLEYRGYDSAGGSWFNADKNEIFCVKSVGRINLLEEKIGKCPFPLNGNPFIFHTRWGTHGK
ncbi:MAG: hypothetical protein QMD05_09340, partial [Candidatus Brocadiaceae bacterium]|nr:hypothetical protein [Candidatus Brocadiaceae bacterium]